MKTASERKRKERAARKAQGQKRLELWAKPELHNAIKEYAQTLANIGKK